MGLCRSLFRKIGKNVLVRCSKPQFSCPEVHDSWKNFAFGNLLIFFQNRIWSKSCMKVFWQLSDNFDKTAIQVSTETFWTKMFSFWSKPFFSCLRTHFWLIFLRQGLQNCTLRTRGSFRGKTFGVRFFFNFSTVSGFERNFFGLIATTLQQHCQKCTILKGETNWGRYCVEKTYKNLTNFGL